MQQDTALWEERLANGLSALAESEAPVPMVTVADVVRSGRGRLRKRTRTRTRTFALCTALVSAAALAAGILTATGPGDAAHPPSTGRPGKTKPIGTAMDPLAPTVAFGWLPSSFKSTTEFAQYATGPNWKADPTAALPPGTGPGYSVVGASAPGGVDITAVADDPGSGSHGTTPASRPAPCRDIRHGGARTRRRRRRPHPSAISFSAGSTHPTHGPTSRTRGTPGAQRPRWC